MTDWKCSAWITTASCTSSSNCRDRNSAPRTVSGFTSRLSGARILRWCRHFIFPHHLSQMYDANLVTFVADSGRKWVWLRPCRHFRFALQVRHVQLLGIGTSQVLVGRQQEASPQELQDCVVAKSDQSRASQCYEVPAFDNHCEGSCWSVQVIFHIHFCATSILNIHFLQLILYWGFVPGAWNPML